MEYVKFLYVRLNDCGKLAQIGNSEIPFNVKHSSAVSHCQILNVPSMEAETHLEPSLVTAMSVTHFKCPRFCFKWGLVSRSHTLKLPSCEPDSALDPSETIATHLECNKFMNMKKEKERKKAA